MAIQRTFTLIPPSPPPARASTTTTAGRGESSLPVSRMTSKQVRKAYKAATRLPSVSHAERLRQERAEQERIRREYEKEKAAARAKAARDRKRDKEAAQREHKRKMGVPLVSVRPSQDTIARFVRPPAAPAAAATINSKSNKDHGDDEPGDKELVALLLEEEEEEQQEHEEEDHDRELEGKGVGEEVQRNAAAVTDGAAGATAAEEKTPLALSTSLSSSPLRPLPMMPMSTQAILGNADEWFPSSSQQAKELQDQYRDKSSSSKATPSPRRSPLPPQSKVATHGRKACQHAEKPSKPQPLIALRDLPPPPPPLYRDGGGTSSSSSGQQHAARNNASADPRKLCTPHARHVNNHHHAAAAADLKATGNRRAGDAPKSPSKRGAPHDDDDSNKENTLQPCTSSSSSSSQESEYGGAWVEELASDLVA